MPEEKKQQSKQLRVAVIGAGGWGYQHARAFWSRKDTQLAAIVGRTAQRTQERADAFQVPWYLDIREMLEKEKPDFVSVCLPAQHTFEATMTVIEAGIPLMSEKPPEPDAEAGGNTSSPASSAADRRQEISRFNLIFSLL